MKRITKLLTLFVVICVLCVSFSGCISVKDMREQHAYFSGNDIVCDGITYKMLSNVPEEVYPSGDIHTSPSGEIQELYITKKDVPTLLSQIFVDDDTTYGITKDKNFITMINTGTLYCREDMFDDIQSKIDKNEILYTNDYTYDRWIEGKFLSTPISTDIIKTIEQIKSTEKQISKIPSKAYDSRYSIGITANLYGNLEKTVYYIYATENDAYIEDCSVSYENTKSYKVPESNESVFLDLINKFSKDFEDANVITY